MRVVEEKMNAAIRSGGTMRCDNTSVGQCCGLGLVRLHDNLIAKVHADKIEITLAGWPTATTRSRLNALLREFCNTGIHQSKHRQYLGDQEIGARDWYTVARTARSVHGMTEDDVAEARADDREDDRTLVRS